MQKGWVSFDEMWDCLSLGLASALVVGSCVTCHVPRLGARSTPWCSG